MKLTVVGAGMIGCSFALAARRVQLFDEILAIEPHEDSASRALSLGYVDRLVETPEPGPVLLACPGQFVAGWLERLGDRDAPVFDVASIKGALLDELERVPAHFVPCHPIAGRERSGPEAASGTLFKEQKVILTPLATTQAEHVDAVEGWWQAVGARVERMDPTEHDRVYARTSHLPHLLAFAYLLGIESGDLAHTGGGFRDFSRIGASDPVMWSGVFERNAKALLEALETFQGDLERFAEALRSGDVAASAALISAARARRLELDEGLGEASGTAGSEPS